MNSTQYTDNLCQAIEIIANNVVKGLNYDKTILCTIKSNMKASNGEYTVSDGSSNYTAYSSNQTFKTNDQVYVLIPNGDYSQQKIIISKYSSSDVTDKGYTFPIDTMIPIEDIPLLIDGGGLIANNPNRNENIRIASPTDNDDYGKLSLGPQYTRLAVQGTFKTQFDQSLPEVTSGTYSIVILLSGEDTSGSTVKDKVYIFSNEDFFGNPYNLNSEEGVTYSTVFDISTFKKIESIDIRFQESGNFYDINNDYYPTSEEHNIFVDNLKFTFGFDVNEFKNNDLLLTTVNPLEYGNAAAKNLQINWVRNTNDNTKLSINDEIDIINNYDYLKNLMQSSRINNHEYFAEKEDNYVSIYWYRYITKIENGAVKDKLLDENLWKLEKFYNNKHYSSADFPSDLWGSDNVFNTIGSYSEGENPFNFSFTPSLEEFREKIKMAVAINGCLRKRVLKVQEIEIFDAIDKSKSEIIMATVLKEKEKPSNISSEDWEVSYELDYDYTYYSPAEEVRIDSIFSEDDSRKDEPITYRSFYWDSEKEEYIECQVDSDKKPPLAPGEISKNYYSLVDWVQYYSKETLSIEEADNGDLSINLDKNNQPIYGAASFVYLSHQEYDNLKDLTFEGKSLYKLKLTPLTFFKSNEIIFTNTDEGIYRKSNLIGNIKLDCLDSNKGKYFIYNMANTIPSSVANNANRKIQISFDSVKTKDIITDDVLMFWTFPKNNTMIIPPRNFQLDAVNTPYRGISGKLSEADTNNTTDIVMWIDGDLISNSIKDNGVEATKTHSKYKNYWIDGNIDTYQNRWVSSKIRIDSSASRATEDSSETFTFSVGYEIDNYYSPTSNNNTITCFIYKKVENASDDEIKINKINEDLLFGPSGTNGTNYTFTLSLGYAYNKDFKKKNDQKQSFLKGIRNITDDTETNRVFVEVEPKLYDGNKTISLESYLDKISWSWLISPNYTEKRTYSGSEKTLTYCTVKKSLDPTTKKMFIRSCRADNYVSGKGDWDLDATDSDGDKLRSAKLLQPKHHCAIMKATLQYESKTLEAYLPIPMSFNDNIAIYEGAERIVYDSSGANPIYFEKEHYLRDGNENIISDLNCEIYVNKGNGTAIDSKYAPYFIAPQKTYNGISYTIYDIGNAQYLYGYNSSQNGAAANSKVLQRIRRQGLTTEGLVTVYDCTVTGNSITWYTKASGASDRELREGTKYVLKANVLKAPSIYYSEQETVPIAIIFTSSNKGQFVQPLLIIQNKHGNSMLNDWDGGLDINENENYILSAKIGAGKKETDNSFTGVLMGDVKDNSVDNATPKTGLYGYNKGALVFAFTEDGKAYLGKSGRGRIEFNGNNGTITSSNWTTNNLGMHLNLDTGVAQFENAGGFVKIDPSQARKIFQIQSANGNILMNVGTDNYYLQSSNYEYQKSGFKMNCGTGGFSLSVPQNTESSMAGGLILSSSSPYLQITKNREQLTENITLEEEGISVNSEIYFNPWGSGIIIRDLDTNKFYWGKFVNRTGTTPWVPKDIPFFMEKHSTFSMKSNDGKSTYTGNIYQVLGQTAIDNFYNYFKLKETINNKNLITMSSSGTYSFDSTNKIVKAKDTKANDGKKYTLEYRLAKFPNCKQTNHYQNCNVELGGHFNSLAYNQEKNILFLAPAGKAAGGNTNPGFIFSFQYDKSDKVWRWKKYHLYNGTAQFTSSIWQVAIDHNEPNILYALNNNGKIFSFEITTGEYEKNDHENITARKTEIQFTNITSANGKYDNTTYTYQGMAVDDKNFYIPCVKGSYTSQWLWVISRTSTTAKYIEFKGMDTNCEIEEIAFDDQGYMYVAAGYTYGGKLQRGVKIYKVAFDPNSLPNTISLGNPVYIIANSSGTYNVCQGFTLGYDKTQKQSFFAFGFKQADSVNDTLRGRIQINYFNEIESLKESALEKTILLNIASNSYYLQSQNYQYIDVGNVGNKGVKLDLKSGKLNAYSFNIQLGKNDGSYIKIDSGASKTPIQVYGPADEDGDRKRCVIGWNGVLTAEGANITGTITATSGSFEDCTIKKGCTIGSWKVGDVSLYYSDASFGSGKAFLYPGGKNLTQFGVTKDWVLGVGSSFGVTSSGELYASAGKIGGCVIDKNGNLQVGNANIGTILATKISGGTLDFSNITVSNLSAESIDTENLTINGSQIVNNTITGNKITADALVGKLIRAEQTGNFSFYKGLYCQMQSNASINFGGISNNTDAPLIDVGLGADQRDLYFGIGSQGALGYYINLTSGVTGTTAYPVSIRGNTEIIGSLNVSNQLNYGSISDINLKNNINTFDFRYEKMFEELKPVHFTYRDVKYPTDQGEFWGFIAQDVEEKLKNNNIIKDQDIISAWYKNKDGIQMLRYPEFIALNTHMIQKCLKRIDELENEIKTLKAQL